MAAETGLSQAEAWRALAERGLMPIMGADDGTAQAGADAAAAGSADTGGEERAADGGREASDLEALLVKHGDQVAQRAAERIMQALSGGEGDDDAAGGDPVTELLAELGYDDDGEPDYGEHEDDETDDAPLELTERDLVELIARVSQATADRAVQPFERQLSDRDADAEFQRLEDTYEELRDETTAERVLDFAQEVGERLGDPSLVTSPAFVELAYKAWAAENRAQQETPGGAGKEGSSLEGASGANPGQPEPGEDEAARIVAVDASKREARELGLIG